MPVKYIAKVDWTNTGSYADISGDVQSIKIRQGRASQLDYVAGAGICTIVVNNASRKYSPAYTGGALYGNLLPGRPVQISIPQNGVFNAYNIIFQGYINAITPDSGDRGSRQTTIECIDLIGLLQTTKLNLPMQYGKTGDQLVAGIVNTTLNAPANSVTLTFSAAPANNDTVTITFQGVSLTYKFTTTYPATTANTIYDDGTRPNTIAYLAAAINQTEGLNTLYGGNLPVPNIVCSGYTTTTLTLSNAVPGATGTGFTVTKSSTAITLSNAGIATNGVDYPAGMINYDTGVQVFPVAGQNWSKLSVNALSAIEEVTRSENGRFFIQLGGIVTWRNQQYVFKSIVNTAMQTNNAPIVTGMTSRDDVYNAVKVSALPTTLLGAGSVVAMATGVISVPGNGSQKVHLPFVDPSTGKPCGAKNLILPLTPGTDWVANEQKDGSGISYTSSTRITFTYAPGGAGIDLTITNTATGTLYFTKLQVRGTGIVSYNPVIAERDDQASIAAYQYRALAINLSLSDNTIYADSLAGYLLSKYKASKFRIKALAFARMNSSGVGTVFYGGSGSMSAGLSIEQNLKVTDYQTGLVNSLCKVIGINYDINPDGLQIDVVTEQLDDLTYWLLADTTYGILGTSTALSI